MTDMHREGFESWAKDEGFDTERIPITDQYRYLYVQARWEVWQEAMRYRDEQDASGTLACVGCGEPVGDPHTFDCPMAERDEQEEGE